MGFIVVDDKGNDFFEKYQSDPPTEEDSFFDETKDMFFGLDADKSGTISVDELASGLDISMADAKKLMEEYDVDKSGELDLMEFELLVFQRGAWLRELQQKHLVQKSKS